jgi:hypothetical protein
METGTFSAIAGTLAARSLIYATLILATIFLPSCKIDTTVDPSEYFTETFSGTLLPNGGTFHSFTVDQAGEAQNDGRVLEATILDWVHGENHEGSFHNRRETSNLIVIPIEKSFLYVETDATERDATEGFS